MYKPRIADKLLVRKLAGKGAVLIEGPKWCGKTTTARQQVKSLLDLGDTEVLKQSRQMMEISSKTLLQGDTMDYFYAAVVRQHVRPEFV